ncbi:MAG: hypothetical protein WC627_07760 [Legionella sp.]|jgi:hypothetical protein
MSIYQFFGRVAKEGIQLGGIAAAVAAASAAVGAATLNAAGHDSYDVTDATITFTTGGAVFGGILGIIFGLIGSDLESLDVLPIKVFMYFLDNMSAGLYGMRLMEDYDFQNMNRHELIQTGLVGGSIIALPLFLLDHYLHKACSDVTPQTTFNP